MCGWTIVVLLVKLQEHLGHHKWDDACHGKAYWEVTSAAPAAPAAPPGTSCVLQPQRRSMGPVEDRIASHRQGSEEVASDMRTATFDGHEVVPS